MNWDWEKLQEQRQRQSGGPSGPNLGDIQNYFKRFRGPKAPGAKFVVLAVLILWALSGIYIVDPDEVGVVKRFGKYEYQTGPGPHYHLPYPIESALTPKVTQVRRVEVGYRSVGRSSTFQQGQIRIVPEESLMLTGDENIVDVQFIVQYQIKDAEAYLFNISEPEKSIKDAAEAAMREVIGSNKIDAALTTGKLEIQNETLDLIQKILDSYKAGIRVVTVQLQNVHPPNEVIDAFKDVASAREDKNRYINEADAYRNDIIPKTRGQAAVIINKAEAYKEAVVRKAQGESARFLDVLAEYNKAKDVTRARMRIETMERVLSDPNLEKVIISPEALKSSVPYLPLGQVPAEGRGQAAAAGETGGKNQ